MAGEWIKLERGTAEKPEIMKLARELKIDRDLVLGKLVRLWCWFDANSVDGRVDGVASTDVDALVTLPGFAAALKNVGWLDFDDEAEIVSVPNFSRHNGESAKKRALKNARQTRWRRERAAQVDDDVDAPASTNASTREEKRRIYIPNGADSPPTIDAALFADARNVFGKSIGGTINKAISAKGKGWVLDIIEQCRGKDPEAARAYLHSALNGKSRERGFQP